MTSTIAEVREKLPATIEAPITDARWCRIDDDSAAADDCRDGFNMRSEADDSTAQELFRDDDAAPPSTRRLGSAYDARHECP